MLPGPNFKCQKTSDVRVGRDLLALSSRRIVRFFLLLLLLVMVCRSEAITSFSNRHRSTNISCTGLPVPARSLRESCFIFHVELTVEVFTVGRCVVGTASLREWSLKLFSKPSPSSRSWALAREAFQRHPFPPCCEHAYIRSIVRCALESAGTLQAADPSQ